MTIATLMLPIILEDVYAPVDKMTPMKGKAGQRVVIHGYDLKDCFPVQITFGDYAPPPTVKSDKVIKFNVPNVPPGPYDVNLVCGEDTEFVGVFTVRE